MVALFKKIALVFLFQPNRLDNKLKFKKLNIVDTGKSCIHASKYAMNLGKDTLFLQNSNFLQK